MGRKKSYEREALIDRALPLFHVHGFGGTSTEMLVEALGVNRNSMYAEFGSKRALFEAVLTRYDAQVMTDIFGGVEAREAGLEHLQALLRSFAASAVSGRAAGLGCMLCNTAVELGGAPEGEVFVQRYFARLQAAFHNALANARRQGALPVSVNVADESRFLTAMALGLFVLVRARAAPRTVQSSTRVALAHLERLRAGGVARPTKRKAIARA